MKSSGLKSLKSEDFETGKALCLGLGSKIEVEKLYIASGGGGTNAAVTFARQGLATTCIGVIGNDANGRDILEELARAGIDTQYCQKHDDDLTAYSVLLVHESGERSILSYKGEGQHFMAGKINFAELDSRWLFLDSLGGHYDLLETAVDWAGGKDVKLAFMPGGRELAHGLEKLKPVFAKAEIVFMNQEEAARFSGAAYEKEDEILKFMDSIILGIFVMTKGPAGVVVSDGHTIYRAGVPDSPVVERTGAGDAFASGFVAEYIRSSDISKAIQFATANASSVVTQYGAKAGILKKEDWGPWPLVEVETTPTN